MSNKDSLEGVIKLLSTKQQADELIQALTMAFVIFEQMKQANEEERREILRTFRSLSDQIKTRLAQLKDGQPGPKGDRGDKGESIVGPPGPQGEKGDKGDPGDLKDLAPEEIRNALELLEGDERLSVDAIKGIDDLLEKIRKSYGNGGVTGLSGRGRVHPYDLSSQLDGSTKTFNIPAVYQIISVSASSHPSVLRPEIDYTYTGQTITFTSQIEASTTLAAGQTVILIVEDA